MAQTQISSKHVTLDQFIVQRLCYLRKMRGFTVSELARRANMEEAYLGKVLRGNRGLKADEFLRLCRALEVGMDEFYPKSAVHDPEEMKQPPVRARFRY